MEEPEAPPLSLSLSRGRVLVWGAAAARELRERHRVTGLLVGPPRHAPSASGSRGRSRSLPLELLPEEGRLLAEGGAARMEPPRGGPEPEPPGGQEGPTPNQPPQDWGRPSPHWPHGGRPRHERRFRVYRDLWGRGLHLSGGGKFGGDFLVYPGPPERFHAAAVALCPPPGAPLALGALVAAARLGTHVRKTLLLCGAGGGAPPTYTSLQWGLPRGGAAAPRVPRDDRVSNT